MEVRAAATVQNDAETQSALHHLALMIAKGEPVEAVLAAVTAEAVRQFGPSSTAGVIRYERDGRTTVVAESAQGLPGRFPTGLTATVLRTGRFTSASEGSRFTAATPVHVDQLLWGLLAVTSPRATPPSDAEQRLAELAELVATAVGNEQRQSELMASRARLVAASDEARCRIERDLHDGAQQYLITMVLRLRSVVEIPVLLPEVRTEIEDIAAELTGLLDDLRELSRGIHPAGPVQGRAALRCAPSPVARASPS